MSLVYDAQKRIKGLIYLFRLTMSQYSCYLQTTILARKQGEFVSPRTYTKPFTEINKRRNRNTYLLGRLFAAFFISLCVMFMAGLNKPAYGFVIWGGASGGNPSLTISSPNPPEGPAGANVIVTADNITPGQTISVAIGSESGGCASATPISGAAGAANSSGSVQISFPWPSLTAGTYPVCAFGGKYFLGRIAIG